MAPVLVLSLIEGLPDTGWFVAKQQGGISHLGWGADRHLSADIYDALSLLARVAGQNWPKGQIPEIPPYPRPETKQVTQPKKKRTVADLYSMFTRKG